MPLHLPLRHLPVPAVGVRDQRTIYALLKLNMHNITGRVFGGGPVAADVARGRLVVVLLQQIKEYMRGGGL